jgi:phage FluMu gp28-like protein
MTVAQGPLPKTDATLPEALRHTPIDGVLLGYQRNAIAMCDASPLAVIEKSRRIGLTWGLAAKAVLDAARRRSARGKNTFYIGYNLDMAKEFVEVCAMWAEAFGHAASAIGEEILDEDTDHPIKAFRIDFGSGFKIIALPSRPRSLRGMQGQVILDEAAFHDSLEEMLKAAMALMIWGGNVIVVSTHDGVDNPFNQLIDKIRAGHQMGQVLTITFADAMADGLYERVCLVSGKTPTEDGKVDWEAEIRGFYGEDSDEELDCKPRMGSGSLIKPEDLSACEHADAGIPEFYEGGLMYVGRDVARRKDGAIIWGFELIGDVLWLRDRYEEHGTTFAHQDAYYDDLNRKRRIAAYWIDQTGMGEKVVEDAQIKHGSYRVHGVLLTGPSRLDLATSLVQRFEDRKIRVPPDPVIRADLRAIKKTSGATGNVRLVNDGEVHADRFWAAGLASRAADAGPVEFDYTAVHRATIFDGRRIVDDEIPRWPGRSDFPGNAYRESRSGSFRSSMRRGRTW